MGGKRSVFLISVLLSLPLSFFLSPLPPNSSLSLQTQQTHPRMRNKKNKKLPPVKASDHTNPLSHRTAAQKPGRGMARWAKRRVWPGLHSLPKAWAEPASQLRQVGRWPHSAVCGCGASAGGTPRPAGLGLPPWTQQGQVKSFPFFQALPLAKEHSLLLKAHLIKLGPLR